MFSRLLSRSHYPGRMIALAVLIALLAVGFLVQTVQANFPPPGYEDRRNYYSDSTKTVQVGGWWFDCNREIRTWGEQTGHVTYSRTQCP